jgi:hypothetical protein
MSKKCSKLLDGYILLTNPTILTDVLEFCSVDNPNAFSHGLKSNYKKIYLIKSGVV